ncbi:hypothetical protein BSKO_07891 [Bryopsis sp. KO-2023]|nr:hypothetical protein BSKO_07891 [Bryopsis sp. KO-2023]
MARISDKFGAAIRYITSMGQTGSTLGGSPLVQAALSGDNEMIYRLIAAGGSPVEMITAKGYGQISPIIAAIHNNHKETAQLLLENMTPSELSIRYGSKKLPALHVACSMGHDEICESLLRKGADIRLPDADGNTALMAAVTGGNLSTVWIVTEKAKSLGLTDVLDEGNNKGQTALHLACDKGNMAMVSCLLKEGADPNKPMKGRGRSGQTPLWVAALAGHADVVQALLTAGSRIHMDQEDRRGLTLLHQAVLSNYPQIVKLLVEHGVHLETGHTQEGDPSPFLHYTVDFPTPALLAAAYGRVECLKAILDGPQGDVDLILEKPGRLDVVAVVVERLTGRVPESAEPPMAWAIQYPCKFVKKSMKVMGVGPNVQFMSGTDHMEVGHVECVELLLRAGAGMTSDQRATLEKNIGRLRREGKGGQAIASIRSSIGNGLRQCARCGMLGLWPPQGSDGEMFCSERCRSVHERMKAPPAIVTAGSD